MINSQVKFQSAYFLRETLPKSLLNEMPVEFKWRQLKAAELNAKCTVDQWMVN